MKKDILAANKKRGCEKKHFLPSLLGKGDHVVVDEVHQGKPLFMYIAGTLGSTALHKR